MKKISDIKMTIERTTVTTNSHKINGQWTCRPDGEFLLTPNDDDQLHREFMEEYWVKEEHF